MKLHPVTYLQLTTSEKDPTYTQTIRVLSGRYDLGLRYSTELVDLAIQEAAAVEDVSHEASIRLDMYERRFTEFIDSDGIAYL